MNETRRLYLKGLKFQLNVIREEKYIDDINYQSTITLGYLSAGYLSHIITQEEYNKLFEIVKKVREENRNYAKAREVGEVWNQRK